MHVLNHVFISTHEDIQIWCQNSTRILNLAEKGWNKHYIGSRKKKLRRIKMTCLSGAVWFLCADNHPPEPSGAGEKPALRKVFLCLGLWISILYDLYSLCWSSECAWAEEGEGWNHNTDDEMTPNILWRGFFDSLHIFLNSDKYIQKLSLYSISWFDE